MIPRTPENQAAYYAWDIAQLRYSTRVRDAQLGVRIQPNELASLREAMENLRNRFNRVTGTSCVRLGDVRWAR